MCASVPFVLWLWRLTTIIFNNLHSPFSRQLSITNYIAWRPFFSSFSRHLHTYPYPTYICGGWSTCTALASLSLELSTYVCPHEGGSNNSKTLRNGRGSISKKSGQAVVQGRHGANCSCLAWASSLLGRNLSLLTLLSSYFSETSGGSMLAEHSRFWILNQTHYLNESV